MPSKLRCVPPRRAFDKAHQRVADAAAALTEGTLPGARIKAKIAMPGGDRMLVSADRF